MVRLLFKKTGLLFLTTLLFFSVAVTLAFAQLPQEKTSKEGYSALKDTVILIIRHAEKPASGFELSPEGQKRAEVYVGYFQKYTIDGKPVKLDYLFAGADTQDSHRPRLTITPLSKALDLSIDTRFQNTELSELAHEIQSQSHGKNILICWRHGEIPNLLSALGVDPEKLIPNAKWPEDVFGWLIQLRYDENGRLFDIKRIDENLLPDDFNKDTLAAP